MNSPIHQLLSSSLPSDRYRPEIKGLPLTVRSTVNLPGKQKGLVSNLAGKLWAVPLELGSVLLGLLLPISLDVEQCQALSTREKTKHKALLKGISE